MRYNIDYMDIYNIRTGRMVEDISLVISDDDDKVVLVIDMRDIRDALKRLDNNDTINIRDV